jgi:hypothetical protein
MSLISRVRRLEKAVAPFEDPVTAVTWFFVAPNGQRADPASIPPPSQEAAPGAPVPWRFVLPDGTILEEGRPPCRY